MKKLSDYQGEAAIDLWVELLEPLTEIFTDKEVQAAIKTRGSLFEKAQAILKTHKKETIEILTRIDPTPVDGLNLLARLVSMMLEFENSEYFSDFFGSSQQEMTESDSAGSATVIIKEGEN